MTLETLKMRLSIVGGVFLLMAASWIYALVPPPRPASAQFFAQQQYAGSSGGTANAITLTLPNMGSLVVGVPITFMPTNTNTDAVTINVNSLGAVNTRRPSSIGLTALSGSEITTGVLTTVVYDGTNFNIVYPVNPAPIGTVINYRAGSLPPGYLAEDGSAVSRTTYAALFTVIGTTYGSGDGSTTFNLPDSRGTLLASLDGGANRITSGGSGCNATALSSTLCGSQNQTLSRANLPNTNVTVTITDPGHTHSLTATTSATAGTLNNNGGGGGAFSAMSTTQISGTNSSTTGISAAFNLNGNVSQTATTTLPPSSLVKRAIKF